VALGTDGPASNDTLDLWEEVKVASLLARVDALDTTLLPAAQVLAMATRHGATALGLDDVGFLAPGMAADLVRLDLDHPSFTPVTSPDELMAHLVWAGSSRSVTDVWVGGEQVLAGGEVLTVDVERARVEVQHRAERLAAG
jgi:5-methylthioadenosine/S-adenosylhomocysteine deaminase